MQYPSNNQSYWQNEERSDQIRVIKDLKKGRYTSALKTLSHYPKQKTILKDDIEGSIGEYFVHIHSAYAYFLLNQHTEAKRCLENILHQQPLDGQTNLFLAYIYLLEGSKTEAIHRYTILLENPFYRSKSKEILNSIRHSESIIALLGERPIRFFYRHQFPNFIYEEWKLLGIEILQKLKGYTWKCLFFCFSLFKYFYRFNILSLFSVPYKNRLITFFLKRSTQLILLLIFFGLLFFWKQEIIHWLSSESYFDIRKNDSQIFSQVIMDKYGKDATRWLGIYRDMEQLIKRRQFNQALKLYNTINTREDYPIEVKNKFYILSTFISPPHFDELVPILSFHDISQSELDNYKNSNHPIGLYYKIAFRVLQMNSINSNKFLIELLNDVQKTKNGSETRRAFSANRAILIIEDNDSSLEVGNSYEAIIQLEIQEKKYLVFTLVVVRSPVRVPRE